MRKTLVLFLILAAASVTFLFCGASAVNEGRDDIIITETTLAGDAAAAEGLQVRTVLNERRQLFWSTDYAVAETPKPVTAFRYYPTTRHKYGDEVRRDVYLDIGSTGFGINGYIDLEKELEYIEENHGANQMLLRPLADLASRTPAGESRTEVVDLRDYYETYPVYLQCDWAGWENDEEVVKAHWAFYQDYFRIPVQEHTYVEIFVNKDSEGRVVEVNCNTYYPEKSELDSPVEAEVMADAYTYTESAVTEDAVWLLLHGTHDYSQIKGGYGLYRIPYSWHSQYGTRKFTEPQILLDVEKIENVYPVDPADSEKIKLAEGTTDGEVLLLEQREDCVSVRVLDTETMEVLQTLELNTTDLPEVWYYDDLVIFFSNDGTTSDWKLHVLRCENGIYSLWLETAFFPLNDEGYFQQPVFAFDGERFAMAAFHQYYEVASHRITVYDREGLLYAGDYHYSSDDLTQPITNYSWDEALSIAWE